MFNDAPQLAIVSKGRQRHKHTTPEQRQAYLDDLRVILDNNSYSSRKKIQAVTGRLCFTSGKAHAPTGKLLRMLLNHHKVDGEGRDFKYKDRFNADGQYVTSRPKLMDDYLRAWDEPITLRQLNVALRILKTEGIIKCHKAPIAKNEWAIFLRIKTRNLDHLLLNPEKVGIRQQLAVFNANARAGRRAKFGTHFLYSGLEAVPGPVPFASGEATSAPISPSSATAPSIDKGVAFGDALKQETAKARGYEPSVAEVIQYAETREIFCNADKTRVARKLPQDEREALARCVRTRGLTLAWLKRYHGAIQGNLDHYTIDHPEEAWWLKVDPKMFANRFFLIRKKLEQSQVLAALEDRRLTTLPITDNDGWVKLVSRTLDFVLEQCCRRMDNPQRLEAFLLDPTMLPERQPMAIIATQTLPELSHLADKVMARWRQSAREYLLTEPRTILALHQEFPIVEWFKLPGNAAEAAQEWLDQEVARWRSEGDELQRRLSKCQS